MVLGVQSFITRPTVLDELISSSDRECLLDLNKAAFTMLLYIQGIEQTKNFMRHSRLHSKANKLLHTACSWAQHWSGWHIPILSDIKKTLPHLKAT
eukprot:8079786-Ditylum_brightwellii.AAC.1